jgi:hypothetical protein
MHALSGLRRRFSESSKLKGQIEDSDGEGQQEEQEEKKESDAVCNETLRTWLPPSAFSAGAS